MNLAHISRAALTLLVLGSVAIAQEGRSEKHEARAIPASAPILRTKSTVSLDLPVMGLKEENSAKVQSALEGMQVHLYQCEKCKAEFAEAGDCPKCKTPLRPTKETVLESVKTDPAKDAIAVQTMPGIPLRLSEVERALSRESVRLDETKMTIPGDATILVSGIANEEQASTIEKSLKDSGLFTTIHVQESPIATRIQVAAAGTAPTRMRVQEALTKAHPGARITDVIWNDWTPMQKS